MAVGPSASSPPPAAGAWASIAPEAAGPPLSFTVPAVLAVPTDDCGEWPTPPLYAVKAFCGAK